MKGFWIELRKFVALVLVELALEILPDCPQRALYAKGIIPYLRYQRDEQRGEARL